MIPPIRWAVKSILSDRQVGPSRSTPTLGAMNSHGSSQAMSGRSQSSHVMSYLNCGAVLVFAGATVIRVCGAFGGCF
jgi:hypothetical protein